MDVAGTVRALSEELRALGSAERAAQEKRYLKSELRFFGVSVPTITAAARRLRKAHPELTRDELLALVAALWKTDAFELRFAGAELLELYADRLRVEDLAFIEELLRASRTWALVDGLAASVAGPLVARFPGSRATLRRWAVDGDFWIRRAALLALLVDLRAGAGDWDLFEELAVPMLGEKEFFIRKAIGWVLRDVSKKRPQLTSAFVERYGDRMAGLTVREATRHLGKAKASPRSRARS